MKKTAILIIYLLLTFPCAFSMSDSVIFNVPDDLFGYYIPQNLDTSIRHTMTSTGAGWINHVYGIGVGFHSTEDIRVKGIAIAAVCWEYRNGGRMRDTVIDYDLTASVFKYFIDYDSVDYLRQAPYNTLYPTATDTLTIVYDSVSIDTIVLHKIFFNGSAVVNDTFFCIVEALADKEDSSFFNRIGFKFDVLLLSKTNVSNALSLYEIPMPISIEHFMDNPSLEWYEIAPSFDDTYRVISFIFPILDLGDSAGVEEVDAVGRNMAVWPNPARGTVSVASGYGLKRVTVHDLGGRFVLSREASGLSTSIDVSSLPRGAYFVTVETLVGTTTKKLLVE